MERSRRYCMLMLLFHIGNDLYVCDCEPVVEVVPKIKLKPIPHSAPYFSGFLNFNGLPIPVIDLRQLIEGCACSSAMHTRIILIKNLHQDAQKLYLGIIVEKMTEVVEEDIDDFIDPGLRVEKLPFLEGVLTRGELQVQFVNVNAFFELLDH